MLHADSLTVVDHHGRNQEFVDVTYAVSGRLDEATMTARDAIDAAGGIDSARVQRRVEQLLDQLPAGKLAEELHDYRQAQAHNA